MLRLFFPGCNKNQDIYTFRACCCVILALASPIPHLFRPALICVIILTFISSEPLSYLIRTPALTYQNQYLI